MSEFPHQGTDKEKLDWYLKNNSDLARMLGDEIVKNVGLEAKLLEKDKELLAALLVIKVLSKKEQ